MRTINIDAFHSVLGIAQCISVTDNFCPVYHVAPPPTSPTTKSAGTPSEAGSQDSDGAVGPRYSHETTHIHLRGKVQTKKRIFIFLSDVTVESMGKIPIEEAPRAIYLPKAVM